MADTERDNGMLEHLTEAERVLASLLGGTERAGMAARLTEMVRVLAEADAMRLDASDFPREAVDLFDYRRRVEELERQLLYLCSGEPGSH